ncbi:MAG: histidine kinase [Rhodoferax sp.]|nr:histidine kinase [Rhodoferax sp.]
MPTLPLPILWPHKLRHVLQTTVFCLAIAGLQYAFHPEVGWEIPLVYSLCIGFFTWALVDFGRHAFASAATTGWPQGLASVLLPLGGMVLGYGLGTLVADRWFGWYSWGAMNRFNLPVSIAITVVAGSVICYYFYAKSRTLYLEARVAEASQQATEARLKLLESQLDPHMLFNTLANLRALIATEPARALAMLDHLNSYLRSTLSASRLDTERHPLEQEFARLRDYLELMQIRMGKRLLYTLELPDALRQLPVPPLLLQPLVENCIRHGLEPQVAGGSIRIAAWLERGQLHLEVVDTGAGFDCAASSGSGFGLAHVRERIATLYPGRGHLHLTSRPEGGTQALVTLPVQP